METNKRRRVDGMDEEAPEGSTEEPIHPSSKRRKTQSDSTDGTDEGPPPSSSASNPASSSLTEHDDDGDDDNASHEHSDFDLDTVRSPLDPSLDFLDTSPANVSKLDRIAALARAKYPPTHVRNLLRYQLYCLEQQAESNIAVVESITKAR